jgi:hypothetical protein
MCSCNHISPVLELLRPGTGLQLGIWLSRAAEMGPIRSLSHQFPNVFLSVGMFGLTTGKFCVPTSVRRARGRDEIAPSPAREKMC